MSLVRGTGTLSLRGLDIINYCNINAEALTFNEAYATTYASTNFTQITDPNHLFGLTATASDGISKEQIDTVLSASTVIPCSINPGTKSFGTSSSILPLTIQPATNAITSETALRLYFMFVKDPVGKRYTLGAGQGANFNIGDTITASSGGSGDVIYVDTDTISVTNIVGTISVGASLIGGSSAPGTGTIVSESDLYILFYYGCLLYDDAGPTVSTISVVPGMSMPIRTQIRFSSGFPDDISFINTSISEIEVHNDDAESHDATHLRLDGNNSPTTDIDWGGYQLNNIANGTLTTDVSAVNQVRTTSDFTTSYNIGNGSDLYTLLTSTLPKRIDHNITITLTASISISSTVFYNPVVFEGFHGKGSITLDLDDFNIDQGLGTTTDQDLIRISGCQIPITVINNGGGGTSELLTRANTLDSVVKIQNCTSAITVSLLKSSMTNGSNLAGLKVVGSPNVVYNNNIIEFGVGMTGLNYGILVANNSTLSLSTVSIIGGATSANYAVLATNGSTVISSNVSTSGTLPTYGLFATNNSVIMKSGTQPTASVASQSEITYRGGIITNDISYGNDGMSKATFPIISSGTVAPAPTFAPTKVGDIYVNTTSKKVYIASGNTASTDWNILN